MGKIKKILDRDLVGDSQKTDVYPVTSTRAVYDENNERLDNILKSLGDKIYNIADGAVSSDKITFMEKGNNLFDKFNARLKLDRERLAFDKDKAKTDAELKRQQIKKLSKTSSK